MRAVILSGSGRYADRWHRFDETSAALAGIVAGAGYRVEVGDDLGELVHQYTGLLGHRRSGGGRQGHEVSVHLFVFERNERSRKLSTDIGDDLWVRSGVDRRDATNGALGGATEQPRGKTSTQALPSPRWLSVAIGQDRAWNLPPAERTGQGEATF